MHMGRDSAMIRSGAAVPAGGRPAGGHPAEHGCSSRVSVPLNAWSRRRSIGVEIIAISHFVLLTFPALGFWRIWHAGLFVAYRLDAASVYLGLELRLLLSTSALKLLMTVA